MIGTMVEGRGRENTPFIAGEELKGGIDIST